MRQLGRESKLPVDGENISVFVVEQSLSFVSTLLSNCSQQVSRVLALFFGWIINIGNLYKVPQRRFAKTAVVSQIEYEALVLAELTLLLDKD